MSYSYFGSFAVVDDSLLPVTPSPDFALSKVLDQDGNDITSSVTTTFAASDVAGVYVCKVVTTTLYDKLIGHATSTDVEYRSATFGLSLSEALIDAILQDTGTDGVVIASAQTVATATNLTNLPTMPNDWITAAGVKADAVTKIQSGLATPASVLAATVDGTYTLEDVLRIMVSALAGKVSGGGTTTITFRDLSDTLNMIAATVDANGNRSGVTITLE